MKKMMLFVGTIAFLSGMGMNLQYALDDYQLRDNLVLVIQAQQTGDFSDTGTTTYQIAEATKTVAEGGWTFDAGLNIWFLNGKAQKHGPSSSYTIKYKCYRPQGDLTECPYEGC